MRTGEGAGSAGLRRIDERPHVPEAAPHGLGACKAMGEGTQAADELARHPLGVMAHDGNVLAVSREKDAVVLLFTDSARTDAVRASVERFLANAFAEGALPEDRAARVHGAKTRRRARTGSATGRSPGRWTRSAA